LAGLVMPSDTVPSSEGVSGVLYDGGLVTPTPATQQYVKHITITNNSPETIYPFLEDANNRTAKPGDPAPAPNYTGTGMFDPFDPLNQEYRGYIGYTQQVDGQTETYMGLLPGNAITINVPLAFWDAGRIIVTTDSADLLGTGGNGNPFLYRDQSTQVTYYGSVSGNTLTFTPVVMWYHSLTAENPNNDAPFQLIEMSFRGTYYNPKTNVGTGFNYLIGFNTPEMNYISANDFDLLRAARASHFRFTR